MQKQNSKMESNLMKKIEKQQADIKEKIDKQQADIEDKFAKVLNAIKKWIKITTLTRIYLRINTNIELIDKI